MTPDLDEIRQALAAAPLTQMPLAVTTTAECYGRDPLDLPPGTSLDQLWCVYDRDEDDPPWIEGMERDDAFLVANAPTWLAACISEIERLRAELLKEPQWYTEYKATEQSERIQRLVAERDAALKDLTAERMALDVLGRECERLRADWLDHAAHVYVAERDAALAEVERLRAENRDLFNSFPICSQSLQGGDCSAENRWKEVVANVVAERDAALARIDELDESIADFQQLAVDRTAERDAALAECERYRSYLEEANCALVEKRDRIAQLEADEDDHWQELTEQRDAALAECERLRNEPCLHSLKQLDAWRACADQLAEDLKEALAYVSEYYQNKWQIGVEALARFDALKAGEQ